MQTARVWLEGETPSEQTLKIQEYVLSGGVYGTFTNKMKVTGTEVTDKTSYALKRIFPPYDLLKNRYPILKKHKWLFPVYQVVRWVETIFSGKSNKLKREIEILQTTPETEKDEFKEFLSELGL